MNDPQAELSCDAVVARTSLFLDGRLRAAVRARVQTHLRGCEACAEVYRQFAQIGSASRELPDPEPAPDLAQRVLKEARWRRAGRLAALAQPGQRRIVLAAAGALVVGGLGYLLGYFAGAAASGQPAEVTVDRGGDEAPRAPGVEDRGEAQPEETTKPEPTKPEPTSDPGPESGAPVPPPATPPREVIAKAGPVPALSVPEQWDFMRAADSLLADLRMVDSLPERYRRPLLQAQLRYFDLPRSAARIRATPGESLAGLRPAAELITRLADELDGEVTDWTGLQAQATRLPSTGTADPARPLRPRRRAALDTLLAEAAPELDAEEREGLRTALVIKEERLVGSVRHTVEFTRSVLREDSAPVDNPMAMTAAVQAMHGLQQAGLADLAQQLGARMVQRSKEISSARAAAKAATRTPELDALQGEARRRMEQMMQRLQREMQEQMDRALRAGGAGAGSAASSSSSSSSSSSRRGESTGHGRR